MSHSFTGLTGLYRSLGRFTARRPWAVIGITVAITLACSVGFLRYGGWTRNDDMSWDWRIMLWGKCCFMYCGTLHNSVWPKVHVGAHEGG